MEVLEVPHAGQLVLSLTAGSTEAAAPSPSQPVSVPVAQVPHSSSLTAEERGLFSAANALAGAGGGVLSLALTYPLYTVITKLQVGSGNYRGPIDATLLVIKQEGWKGLYAGLSTALIANAYAQGVYYYWYALFRSFAEGRGTAKKREVGTLLSLIIGALAGAITAFFTNPLWVITTRMQTQNETAKKKELEKEKQPEQTKTDTKPSGQASATKKHLGFLQVSKEIWQENGIRGFWSGLVPALVLVFNPAIQYMVYEQLKLILFTRRGTKPSSFQLFLLGAVAKAVATIVTYPYITIKTRLQARGKYKGTMDAIRKIIAEEKIAGFYKGMESKIVQSVLTAAFLLAAQDRLAKWIFALLSYKKRTKK